MDRERKKHWRTVKLVFTEILMVIAVIVTVIFLTFIAMGYNLNKNGELGQQGIVQIQSRPSGATIQIDEDILFQRTNTAKMLSAGRHNVAITKDGYDGWTKEIMVESGIVLKLDYPRLFLNNRTPEKMREYTNSLVFYEPAPNHDAVIYAKDDDITKWTLLDIRGDDAIDNEIDLTSLLTGLGVNRVIWNNDSDKLLVEANRSDKIEWLLINTKNPEKSVNLTKEYSMDFSFVAFLDNSGEKLLILENQNLRSITTKEKTVSQVLASGVTDVAMYGNAIMYLTTENEMKLYKENEEDYLIAQFDIGRKVKISLSQYLDKKYIGIISDDRLFVYKGDMPDGNRTLGDMELVCESSIKVFPHEFKVYSDGEFLIAKTGNQLAVFDAELLQLHEIELESDQMFFIDLYIIGTIGDEKLIIRDFDGTNRRELATATGTAIITRNNKWLYYLRVDNGNTNIFREQILD